MIRLLQVTFTLLFLMHTHTAGAADSIASPRQPAIRCVGLDCSEGNIRAPMTYEECIKMPQNTLNKFLPGKSTVQKKCRKQFPLPPKADDKTGKRP